MGTRFGLKFLSRVYSQKIDNHSESSFLFTRKVNTVFFLLKEFKPSSDGKKKTSVTV